VILTISHHSSFVKQIKQMDTRN